jgi:hypothetical protein
MPWPAHEGPALNLLFGVGVGVGSFALLFRIPARSSQAHFSFVVRWFRAFFLLASARWGAYSDSHDFCEVFGSFA